MNLNIGTAALARAQPQPRPAFIYRHVVSFEETNVVGNVYFTRHIAWQGRCREMFLKQHAPDILNEIARDLRLVTLRVSCDYFEELHALDEIDMQMSLAYLRQHRIGLDFEIMKLDPAGSKLAARGFQEIGCMRASGAALAPISPPASLAKALKPFQTGTSSGRADQQ
jgi:enediyne core biosynthesis thioesterase